MPNDPLLLPVLYVIGGLVGLAWGADRFVSGAGALARSLGVSALLVGIVVVGFGTSAPELLVSGNAAWRGNPDLAVGNALGSNIANVALVLGTAALAAPLAVHSRMLWHEIPLTLIAMLVAGAVLVNLELGRAESVAMLVLLVLFLLALVRRGRRERWDALNLELERSVPAAEPAGRAAAWTVIGLLVLLASAHILVVGAVDIAQAFQISELVIGLTVVAIGTSLPELAATLASARRNEAEIAIGNVLGSNTFNMLGVIGVAGVIQPATVDAGAVYRDWPVMVGTFALFVLAAWRHERITRLHGALFLAVYAAYMVYLGVNAGV